MDQTVSIQRIQTARAVSPTKFGTRSEAKVGAEA